MLKGIIAICYASSIKFWMYMSISFELKCAVNSVAMKLLLAPLISYSLQLSLPASMVA